MRERSGHVLWLVAGLLVFLTFTSMRSNGGGEFIFGPLAFICCVLAYVLNGPPWKL